MSIPENLSTQFQKALSRLDQSIEKEFPIIWNGRDVSLLSSDANKGELLLFFNDFVLLKASLKAYRKKTKLMRLYMFAI